MTGLPSLWAVLAVGYVGAGAGVAWHLGRRGYPFGTASAALVCWPLLLDLIGRAPTRDVDASLHAAMAVRRQPPPPRERGRQQARIKACVEALREAMADEALRESAALVDPGQLARLVDVLHRVDRRLDRIDALITDAERQRHALGHALGDAPATSGASASDSGRLLDEALTDLRRARDDSRAAFEAVLGGLVSLRVQLGLFALAGDAAPVRERLADLEARVAALAEISSMGATAGEYP